MLSSPRRDIREQVMRYSSCCFRKIAQGLLTPPSVCAHRFPVSGETAITVRKSLGSHSGQLTARRSDQTLWAWTHRRAIGHCTVAKLIESAHSEAGSGWWNGICQEPRSHKQSLWKTLKPLRALVNCAPSVRVSSATHFIPVFG